MTTVNERAARIRMVVLDIDGVMSDGTINVSGTGELYKSFYVRDGLGIKMLQKHGIEIAIITGRTFLRRPVSPTSRSPTWATTSPTCRF